MVEKISGNYLWQNIGNQGYNKYKKGVIGPGSKESIERAANFHAGDGVTTTGIEVLDKPTHINNRWGGFGTDYHMDKGELRMTYGPQPIDYMDARWQKYAKLKGKKTLVDQAGSVDNALMESTHREVLGYAKDGKPILGDFLTGKLRVPGSKYTAVKDANIGITIPTTDMKYVLTSEALKKGASPTELKPGMVIAHDALGVYLPPLKTVLKKNKPVDIKGEAIVKKLTKFDMIQKKALQYEKERLIPKGEAERLSKLAWKYVQKWAKNIKK